MCVYYNCFWFLLQIEIRDSIAEALYTYDALQKRKPFLDQLMEGLQEFELSSAMQVFPDIFEPLFVCAQKSMPQDVINILHIRTPMTDAEQVVYDFLELFIRECNPTGMLILMELCVQARMNIYTVMFFFIFRNTRLR